MLYGLDLTTLADADTKLHCNAKPMRKPLAGRRGRTQWCDASARCGSKRYLCGVIRQRGLHHRHKGAKEERERTATRRAHSGQRGKRSREYDRSTKSDRHLDKRLPLYDRRSFATMWNCTATVTLSDLPITTTGKVSQKGSSEIFILHNKSLFLQKENLSPQEKTHLRNKKSHICGSIWGINLGNAAYIFVYQLVTMLQPISTGLLAHIWQRLCGTQTRQGTDPEVKFRY